MAYSAEARLGAGAWAWRPQKWTSERPNDEPEPLRIRDIRRHWSQRSRPFWMGSMESHGLEDCVSDTNSQPPLIIVLNVAPTMAYFFSGTHSKVSLLVINHKRSNICKPEPDLVGANAFPGPSQPTARIPGRQIVGIFLVLLGRPRFAAPVSSPTCSLPVLVPDSIAVVCIRTISVVRLIASIGTATAAAAKPQFPDSAARILLPTLSWRNSSPPFSPAIGERPSINTTA